MRKVSFYHKIFSIIVGVGLFFVILEISLRILGFICLSILEYRNRNALKESGVYRIMCLGESTTFGYDEAYPAQLEKILNQSKIGIKFCVINLGIPGVDTNFILENLEENLNRYRPHLVTVMMGINDKNIISELKKSSFFKIKFFLRRFKSYNLIRLAIIHMKAKLREFTSFYRSDQVISMSLSKDMFDDRKREWNHIKLGWHYKNQNNYKKAEEMFKRAIEVDPLNEWAYIELARVYKQSNRNSEALDLFKKFLAINPLSYRIHIALGWHYYDEKKYEDAENFFKKALYINQNNAESYIWLGQTYIQKGELLQAKEFFEKAISLDPYNEHVYSALIFLCELLKNPEEAKRYIQLRESLNEKYYHPITRNNYIKLSKILKKRNIKLVCIQYPMRSVQPLKDIFKDKTDIIFVDNEAIFKEAVKREGYRSYFVDNFAGDFGHCTAKGNHLLAQNIANVILKECFHE